MGMPEEVLKFTGERPKTVVLILLGFILVGGTGGGIWIKTLQSNLDARDKLFSDRLALLEVGHARDLRLIRDQNSVLRSEVGHLRVGIEEMSSAIATIEILAKRLQDAGRMTAQEQSLLREELTGLEVQRKAIETEILRADAISEVELERVDGQQVSAAPQRALRFRYARVVLVVLGALVLIAALYGLWIFGKRREPREPLDNDPLENPGDSSSETDQRELENARAQPIRRQATVDFRGIALPKKTLLAQLPPAALWAEVAISRRRENLSTIHQSLSRALADLIALVSTDVVPRIDKAIVTVDRTIADFERLAPELQAEAGDVDVQKSRREIGIQVNNLRAHAGEGMNVLLDQIQSVHNLWLDTENATDELRRTLDGAADREIRLLFHK